MLFEEYEIGQKIQVGSHTVHEKEVDRFIDLVGLHNSIFMSDEGAQALGHPRRVVPGPLQFSIAMGLGQQAGLFDHMVIGAQFDNLRFHRPVHPGDTLHMSAVPVRKRLTSNPGRGLVVLDYEMINQDEQVIVSTTGTYLFLTRAGAE